MRERKRLRLIIVLARREYMTTQGEQDIKSLDKYFRRIHSAYIFSTIQVPINLDLYCMSCQRLGGEIQLEARSKYEVNEADSRHAPQLNNVPYSLGQTGDSMRPIESKEKGGKPKAMPTTI